jgi:protein-tyrosine phosphatase
MAEGVFRKLLSSKGRESDFDIDSVGTHDYQIGAPPSPLAVEAAHRRGYDISPLVARQIRAHDLDHYDMILVMDRANLSYLSRIAPTRVKQKIELLLAYGEKYHGMEVPDPFGKDANQFEMALDMIEDGCKGLVEVLTKRWH